MAAADEEAMEGGRRGFGVEEATGPVGAVSVGGEGREHRFGIFAHHEGGVRGSRKSAPRGQGGGRERGGGGPRPTLECRYISLDLPLLWRMLRRSSLSFVFPYCWWWWCGRPTMTS